MKVDWQNFCFVMIFQSHRFSPANNHFTFLNCMNVTSTVFQTLLEEMIAANKNAIVIHFVKNKYSLSPVRDFNVSTGWFFPRLMAKVVGLYSFLVDQIKNVSGNVHGVAKVGLERGLLIIFSWSFFNVLMTIPWMGINFCKSQFRWLQLLRSTQKSAKYPSTPWCFLYKTCTPRFFSGKTGLFYQREDFPETALPPYWILRKPKQKFLPWHTACLWWPIWGVVWLRHDCIKASRALEGPHKELWRASWPAKHPHSGLLDPPNRDKPFSSSYSKYNNRQKNRQKNRLIHRQLEGNNLRHRHPQYRCRVRNSVELQTSWVYHIIYKFQPSECQPHSFWGGEPPQQGGHCINSPHQRRFLH